MIGGVCDEQLQLQLPLLRQGEHRRILLEPLRLYCQRRYPSLQSLCSLELEQLRTKRLRLLPLQQMRQG